VIQYVYRKYTRERAALAATVICYRTKSALRDVGKALGMPLAEVDALAKSFTFWDQKLEPSNPCSSWRHAARLPAPPVAARRRLRHLARPLAELVPIENAAMPERSVIQWDKDDLEALGLLKVDVLALGMLTAIRRALRMIGMEMHEVPPEDAAVYAMIQKADTIGVFQIESRAQMSMLPRLRPACFYDLVIEVAIVRPGPIQGGMVHPYLRRRRKEEPVDYPSPEVKRVLERTLGVPIFQEQVMELAMVAAGLHAGRGRPPAALDGGVEAQRRAGAVRRAAEERDEGQRLPAEFADAIYRQILGFGEYGFPESHSASFALLVYVSSWLKCHHPARSAQRCSTASRWASTRRRSWCRMRAATASRRGRRTSRRATGTAPSRRRAAAGLRMVSGLPRRRGGASPPGVPHASVAALQLGRKDLRALAAAGALQSLAGHRRQAHWAAAGAERRAPLDAPAAERPPALARPKEGRGDRGGLCQPRPHAGPPSAGAAPKAPGPDALLKPRI
jgi:error-prone DNA polymerase